MKGKTGKTALKLMPKPHGPMEIDSAGEKMIERKHGGKVDGKKPRGRADKMARGGKKWIQKAHLKKGAFTAQAKRAGESVHELAEKKKNAPGKTGKRARLALTFEKMAH